MNRASKIRKRLRGTFTWYFSSKIVLALFVIAVSATSISVITTNHQADIGGALNVTNRLVAVDRGFSQASTPVTATGTSCSTATRFGVGNSSNTNITALHYVYDVAVNEAFNATANTCYKASFVLSLSGIATTYGPVYMNSTASIVTTFVIDCKFDIGASTPSSPYSFQLTIQSVP